MLYTQDVLTCPWCWMVTYFGTCWKKHHKWHYWCTSTIWQSDKVHIYHTHKARNIILFTSITGWPLFWRFVAVLGGTQHVKCYSYHACTSATVSGGERMQQCMIQNHIFNIRLLLNTCMDTNMQQTVLGNFSLSRFFPLTFPWFLVKSLTFPWQLSNSLTFPAFPDKWSPCNLLLVCVSFTIIGQPRNSVLIRRV